MRYVHVVFTLPHELAPLALANQKVIYGLLFRVSAETLLELARDPRPLGADIGFFSVLHTWDQKLEHHPHVHSVVPEGGIAPDGARWVRPRYHFFLPVKALAKAFRGKFLAALRQAFAGDLRFSGQMRNLATPHAFAALLRQSCRHDWVVYAKRPFGGPEHVLQYLGNYTHRIAISNHRLVGLADGTVNFRWRDSAHGNKKRVMSLRVEEFLRRFFLHVLPRGFVRIRHFGLLANRKRANSSSTLFPVAPAIRSARSRRCLAGRAPHSHAAEVSSLRRNHAGCRAPLRRPTPPPISASSHPVRRMNPHFQSRISLVLRCAHWFCVSHLSECSVVVRFRLPDAPPPAHSLRDSLLKPQPSDRNCKLANDRDRLIQIQIP